MIGKHVSPFRRLASTLLLVAVLPASAQQKPSTPTEPTLQVTSRLVYVDVVVRDKAGHPVHGLLQSDFAVREDGASQQVSLFEEHQPGAHLPAQKAEAKDPSEYTNISHAASPNGVNVVLLDLVNTSVLDRVFARQQMLRFLRQLPSGHQTALFLLSDHLHMLQGVTGDAALLAQAATAVEPALNDRTPSHDKALRDRETSAYIEQGLDNRPTRLADALRVGLAQEEAQNTKIRQEATADAFAEIARALSGYPGRKNIFWLAGAFPPTELFTIQTAGTLGDLGSSLRFDGPHSLQQVLRDSQLTIYPISVAGIETDSVGAAASGLGQDPGSNQVAFFRRQDIRSTMDTIAKQTGGQAFYGTNDIAGAMQRGFEDGENFYTLAYQPRDRNWNRALRHISVDVARSGIRLDYRRSYLALAPDTRAHSLREFQLALASDIPSTALSVRAMPHFAGPVLNLDLTLDLEGISFFTDSQGKRTAKLLVAISASPLEGSAKTRTEQSGYLNLSLTPDQYAAMLRSGVSTRQKIMLEKGQYSVRVGVFDTADGNIGTLTIPASIP